MAEINAKIIVDDDVLNQISDSDIDGAIESWIDRNLDVDSEISNWMNYNFDIDNYLQDVDFDQYINSNDVEDQARSLLESYSPVTSCQTGEAFTDAVAKAIRYLLLDNEYVEYLTKSIERYERSKIKEELDLQLKEKHFNEFKRELETLRIAEEKAMQQAVAEVHNQLTAQIADQV